MTDKTANRVFVVVEVWRGIASNAHCFGNLPAARECYRNLTKDRNMTEDDVQIFEAEIEDDVLTGIGPGK